MVMRHIYTLLILLLLLVLNPALSLSAQLKAIPDRTRVGLDESFNLELRADGSLDGDPDLSVLEQNFELLGRSQSSQMQIINGDFSRSTVWSLTLMARSAGSKEIPALCVGSDCSKPIKIEVLPAGKSNTLAGANDLLLEVATEPNKVWVQSQVLYKVKLLTRLNFLQASLSEPEPVGIEAVVQKLGEDRNYETERDGVLYRVFERDYLIFPQQSGQLKIPPVRFTAQVADGGRRSLDPFNQRTRQIRRSSEEINIEVLPAAESEGRSWLPARELQLEDDWQNPPRLTVGEPATRTITLRAMGVPAAQLPALKIDVPDGFRSYPDQPKREDRLKENGVLGILQEKLALVPTRPGTLRLPEIKIDWWDLDDERWHQARLPALDVEVLPATNQPAVTATPPAVPQQEPLPQEDKPRVEVPTLPTPEEQRFWPWLSMALGGGWLLTLLFIVKGKLVKRNQENKQEQQEDRPDLKTARKRLDQALASGNPALIRSAMLDWGSALFPKQRPGNLEELAALCGEPLKQKLELFSRSLYSRESNDWDSHGLSAAVQEVQQKATKAENYKKLPPLYPH
ncbi:MAG: BatD family protein [Desulfuromonadales bacterium]|nr:BatD family protein [Desulfuromonadales bacterium]